MTSSSSTRVTFGDLHAEIRNLIYEHMITKPKTIRLANRAPDLGQLEDFRTLRAIMHACREKPRYAVEAYEMFFKLKTVSINAGSDLGLLNRPAYYIKGQGFQPTLVLIKKIEIRLIPYIGHLYELRECFRVLLACDTLRCVTVKVGLGSYLAFRESMDSEDLEDSEDSEGLEDLEDLGYLEDDEDDEDDEDAEDAEEEDDVDSDSDSADLEGVLTVATEAYQKLKEKIGEGLKFETGFPRLGEKIKAWEEGMDKAAVTVSPSDLDS